MIQSFVFNVGKLAAGNLDNKASCETSDVVKILALLAALTTPTVLIGILYGMNLVMPGYRMPHAYPIAVAADIVSTIALVIWLRYKRRL